jgi:leucyl aminopeptidase
MGYAAEEVGIRGSKAIAASFKTSGESVIGVAQFDMSSYKGSSDLDMALITDYTNGAQNQFLKDLASTYFPNLSVSESQCGYACSDHASWHNEGFAASFPAESRFNDSNPNIHKSTDTSFDASHSVKFAKLAVAYVAELAKAVQVERLHRRQRQRQVKLTKQT